MKGDGSVYRCTTVDDRRDEATLRYAVALRVTSLSFAEHFSVQLAKVLGRLPTRIQGPYSDNCYVSRSHSVEFFRWWKGLSRSQAKGIAREFPRHYLKGRYDSEAGVGDYSVYLFGAVDHEWVLELDIRLTRSLGIRSGPILPYGEVGSITSIRGRKVVSKIQELRFTVNSKGFIRVLGHLAVSDRNRKLHASIEGRNWTPWSRKVRRKALALGRHGLSTPQISEEICQALGVRVPPVTIYYWSRGTQSWAGYVSARRLKG